VPLRSHHPKEKENRTKERKKGEVLASNPVPGWYSCFRGADEPRRHVVVENSGPGDLFRLGCRCTVRIPVGRALSTTRCMCHWLNVSTRRARLTNSTLSTTVQTEDVFGLTDD
jgi:hypothetical protein